MKIYADDISTYAVYKNEDAVEVCSALEETIVATLTSLYGIFISFERRQTKSNMPTFSFSRGSPTSQRLGEKRSLSQGAKVDREAAKNNQHQNKGKDNSAAHKRTRSTQ